MFKNEDGFSIAELVIALIIFVVLLMGVLFVFEFGLTNANTLRIKSGMNVQANSVMEKMIRQIRCANQFVVPPVVTGRAANPAYFVANTRGEFDGQGNDIYREVMFYRTTSDDLLYTCERVVGDSTWEDTELAKYTTALTFTYYDATGDSLGVAITEANRKSIKRVDITLTMRRTYKPGENPIEVTVKNSVVVRSKLVTTLWRREVNV